MFCAAGLANYLQNRFNLYLNGLILVSGVIDFETLRARDSPTRCSSVSSLALTASAHYQRNSRRISRRISTKAIAESRAFAEAPMRSPAAGARELTPAEQKTAVDTLARLTGLPASYIRTIACGCRPRSSGRLLRMKEKFWDASMPALSPGTETPPPRLPEFDPSHVLVSGVFSSAMNSYVREDLKFENLPYEILTSVQPWNFSRPTGYPSTAGDLGGGDEGESAPSRAGAVRVAGSGVSSGWHSAQPSSVGASAGVASEHPHRGVRGGTHVVFESA